MKKPQIAFSMLFPYTALLFTFVFLGMLSACYAFLFSSGKVDVDAYEKLMESSDPTRSEAQSAPYIAKQERLHASKDIFFTNEAQRLQLRLRSARAELVLDHQETTEIVEHMYNVICYMQEELYYLLADGREAIRLPNGQLALRRANEEASLIWIAEDTKGLKPMQIIRYMEADKVLYYYKTDRCVAEGVVLSRFSIPGHELQESRKGMTLIMTGVAQSIEFFLKGDGLTYTAKQLKATFLPLARGANGV